MVGLFVKHILELDILWMYVLRLENILEYQANIDIHIFFLNIFYIRELRQGFKIIYFLMGPWDPRAMILTGLRTLGMGPIIDIFIHCKFRKKMCPQDAGIW